MEPSDLDQIKSALSNYANKNESIKAFKKELIEDLTNFQNQIKVTQVQRLEELKKQNKEKSK